MSRKSWPLLFTALLLFLCLCLSGCVSRGRATVEIGGSPPEDADGITVTPSPAPTQEVTLEPTLIIESLDPVSYTPPQFLGGEGIPEEKSPIINPKKATYERLGIDPEQNLAFEEEAAVGKELPIISVSTEGGEYIVSRTEYSSCVIDVFNCPEELVLSECSAGIRVRGNSSGYYGDVEKIKANPVPYRIKFDKKSICSASTTGQNAKAGCC